MRSDWRRVFQLRDDRVRASLSVPSGSEVSAGLPHSGSALLRPEPPTVRRQGPRTIWPCSAFAGTCLLAHPLRRAELTRSALLREPFCLGQFLGRVHSNSALSDQGKINASTCIPMGDAVLDLASILRLSESSSFVIPTTESPIDSVELAFRKMMCFTKIGWASTLTVSSLARYHWWSGMALLG